MKTTNIKYLLPFLVLGLLAGSCKKMITVGTPENQLTTDKVFSDSTAALAALLNTYALFNISIESTITPYWGLYADELDYSNGDQGTLEFSRSNLSADNATNLNNWKNLYTAIYQCNDIISQLQNAFQITAATRMEFIGEAKFLRAYAYFYLVNSYGQIPLVMGTDVKANSMLPNTDADLVYAQIKADLLDASNALAPDYRGDGKVRANRWAALALLARVYLYQQDWVDAESSASNVINSGLYLPLENPSQVFLANSTETILQCWTQYGYTNSGTILIPDGSLPNFTLSNHFMGQLENGDARVGAWMDSVVQNGMVYYYPFKYHNRAPNTLSPEYLTMLRVTEQILIRAEARARQNNLTGANEDLNMVRSRAALPNMSAADMPSVLKAIMHERQVELFAEWGHRFFDLKRTGSLNQVIGSYKPDWRTDTSSLFPIPRQELVLDPNLKQNPGY